MFLIQNNTKEDSTCRDFIAEWKRIGLNQPFQNTLPRWWMKYFYSYLLYTKSQRRYWYRSLWGQFLRTVLTYLEAIIHLMISMQPKTSQSFSTQMPFTTHPPHHQIQGTRKDICRRVGWRSEGWTPTVDLLPCGFPIICLKRCLAASHFSLLWSPMKGSCLEIAEWLRHSWR